MGQRAQRRGARFKTFAFDFLRLSLSGCMRLQYKHYDRHLNVVFLKILTLTKILPLTFLRLERPRHKPCSQTQSRSHFGIVLTLTKFVIVLRSLLTYGRAWGSGAGGAAVKRRKPEESPPALWIYMTQGNATAVVILTFANCLHNLKFHA